MKRILSNQEAMEKWLGDWAERQKAYREAGAENETANQLAYEDMLIK